MIVGHVYFYISLLKAISGYMLNIIELLVIIAIANFN